MVCHQISHNVCFALGQYLRFEENRIEEEVEELRGKMEVQIRSGLVSCVWEQKAVGENERYWNPHDPLMPIRLWELVVLWLVQKIYKR